MLVPAGAAPLMRGTFCPVTGSNSPNSTAFFSSSVRTCFFVAVSQLGIGGKASSLNAPALGSTASPLFPTSNCAYWGGSGFPCAATAPAPKAAPVIIGAGAWYPCRAGGEYGSSRCFIGLSFFPAHESPQQSQHFRKEKQLQQHEYPQQQHRAMHVTMDRIIKDPMTIMIMTGHLKHS